MRRFRAREPLPLDLGPASERPRSAQVYEALKAAIVSLRLAPGTPISEHRLCRHSGMSRTPVREAIIRLSQEGLVEVFPQQGSRVAPISLGRVMQGHFIRKTLEMAVMRRAASRWRDPFRSDLTTYAERMSKAAAAGDHHAFHCLDEQFHATFAACAGLPEVSRVIQDAKIELDRARQLANPVEGHMQKVLAEHAAIERALAADDAADAETALQHHLDSLDEIIPLLIQRHREFFSAERDLGSNDPGRMGASRVPAIIS